jgi:hypothetical protein
VSLLPVEHFQSDFENVHAELGRIATAFTVRHQEFLNWRYADQSERRYRAALVRLGDQTEGYVVVRMIQHIAHVMDVFVRPTSLAVKALPRVLAKWARQLGGIAVYLDASKGNVFAPAFRRGGFLMQRKTGSVVVDSRSMRRLEGGLWRSLPRSAFYFATGDGDAK